MTNEEMTEHYMGFHSEIKSLRWYGLWQVTTQHNALKHASSQLSAEQSDRLQDTHLTEPHGHIGCHGHPAYPGNIRLRG